MRYAQITSKHTFQNNWGATIQGIPLKECRYPFEKGKNAAVERLRRSLPAGFKEIYSGRRTQDNSLTLTVT